MIKPHYKLVVLGDGGVGKTALTIQLCLNHFIENYDPTIEDSYRKHAIVDNEPCLIEILDTAGQEEFTALRDQWIREGDGFLIVYSITHRQSFDRLEQFRNQIIRVKDTDSIPIMLVGNKCDSEGDRQVLKEDGLATAAKISCRFIETSAKTRYNLDEAYYSVIRDIRAQRPKSYQPDGMGYYVGGRRSNRNKKRRCVIL